MLFELVRLGPRGVLDQYASDAGATTFDALAILATRGVGARGGLAGRTAGGAGEVAPAYGERLAALKQVARSKAGFAAEGEPVIVDSAMGVNPNSIAAGLRGQGFNARSVSEIFGRDPGDVAIGALQIR
jgi:hypothetical protein